MRAPITSFNGWILTKINGYLEKREGCSVHTTEYTNDGARTVLQDSLGFVYEVSIKTIGRTQRPDRDSDNSVSVGLLERVK